MLDRNRPMDLQHEADLCGVSAATYAAALECVRKEQETAEAFAIALQKFYPGYPWEVRCEAERAAVLFRLPIMPPRVYFIVPFRFIMNGPTDMERTAKFTGGELLEKFGLSRSGIKFAEFEDARPRPVLLPGLGAPITESKPKLILPN